jgi:hypothetical protein
MSRPACVPTEEVCNRIDDDCDGVVDEDQAFDSLGAPKVIWAEPGWQVFGADLVAVDGGLLVALQHSLDEPGRGHNQTTLRIDVDGNPIGEHIELDTRASSSGPRLSLGPNGGVSIASCGNDGHETFAYSALVRGSSGKLIGQDVRRSPTSYSCGADTPDGFFAGDQFLYGWVENSSTADGDQVVFDVADAKLRSLDTKILSREGDLAAPPRFAMRGDRLALSYGLRGYPRDSVLRVHVFQDPLAALPDPVEFAAPDGQDWSDVAVLPSARGFLLIGDNRFNEGLLRAAVDVNGSVLERTATVEGAAEKYSAVHASARVGGGFALAASIYSGDPRAVVMSLDDDGRIATTVVRPSKDVVMAARALPDGRVAVLYSESRGDQVSALAIEFFGCSM